MNSEDSLNLDHFDSELVYELGIEKTILAENVALYHLQGFLTDSKKPIDNYDTIEKIKDDIIGNGYENIHFENDGADLDDLLHSVDMLATDTRMAISMGAPSKKMFRGVFGIAAGIAGGIMGAVASYKYDIPAEIANEYLRAGAAFGLCAPISGAIHYLIASALTVPGEMKLQAEYDAYSLIRDRIIGEMKSSLE